MCHIHSCPGTFKLAIPPAWKWVKSPSSRASTEICAPHHPEWAQHPTRGNPLPWVISGWPWPLLHPTWVQADFWRPCLWLTFLLFFYCPRSFTVFVFIEWKNRVGQLSDRILWHHWIQPNPRSEVSTDKPVSQSPCSSLASWLWCQWHPQSTVFPKERCCSCFTFRILEFENPQVTSNNKGTGCEFELWDCGGDPKYVSFRALAPSNDSKISCPPGTLDSDLAPFLTCVWGLINDW